MVFSLVFLLLCALPASAARFYRPPDGFMTVPELPADFRARILSIRLDRKDAFEGTTAHSGLERRLYGLGNRLHILSRGSTLRRRLLFAEGGEATRDRLAETERALRAEEFLSDAFIAVKPSGDGGCDIVVTTFDQWTTVPGGGPAVRNLSVGNLVHGRWDRILGEEWYWWAGISEVNLAGTGTRVGAALRHDPVRDTREISFTNNNLTPLRLKVLAYASWLSDGQSLRLDLGRPLLSRADRYAYSLSLAAVDSSERVYFDANDLASLPDSLAAERAGDAHLLRLFERVATREMTASALRSYGEAVKFDIGPTFQYRDRYNRGGLGEADTALLARVPLPASARAPEERTDALVGAAASLYRYGYATTVNFRNLKWSESVETGWRLTAKAALNQEWLGAGAPGFRLFSEAAWSRFLTEAAYLNTGATWQTFLSPGGDPADGQTDAWGEGSLREHRLTATWLSASWTSLFATPRSRQVTLGELNGLSGYPSFYYAGQARFLATAEQRLFADFEWLTLVPAFSAFVAAGNAFRTAADFDPADLHYSAGLGLRLGRSKSTQKTVQHINVNVPLGDDYLRGAAVSVLVKKTL